MSRFFSAASTPAPSSSPVECALGGREFAQYLRVHLPDLPERVTEDVWRALPVIARAYGHEAMPVIDQELRTFVRGLSDLTGPPEEQARTHRALGRSAYLHGIGPDLLQSAYHAGARFAWRRLADVARTVGATADQLYGLTESVLATAEELSAHALAAYTDLSHPDADVLRGERRRLLRVILAGNGAVTPEVLVQAARTAQWTIPGSVACVVLDRPWEAERQLSPPLGPDVLSDLHRPEPLLILPGPDRPGRIDRLRRGLRGTRFAVGTQVPVQEAAQSLRTAERALALLRNGTFSDLDHVRCDDHLPALLLLSDEHLARQLVGRRLAAMDELEREPRERLTETLLAWLTTGSHAQAAVRLRLHPQTVRYRMRRLEELFGRRLHDPAWRFEMELAIRAHRLLSRSGEDPRGGTAL
ncbi:helix-turn-helix domain-containing protein [Spirillospora sp. NPDC049024]